MSKFAIGEQVENVANDHESGTVVAVFPTVDGSFRYAVDTEGYGTLQFFAEEKLAFAADEAGGHMTGRATTQAIAATELTEGDSDAVRIRHQLDAWANASNRTPRLVATPAEDLSVESSGEAPVAGNETQPRLFGSQSHQGGQGHQGQVSQGQPRPRQRGQDSRGQRGRCRAGGARRRRSSR